MWAYGGIMSQCECIISEYHPFGMGGNPYRSAQCKNEATIRVFSNPEIDEDQSPMVVCDRCYDEFKKLNPDYKIEVI